MSLATNFKDDILASSNPKRKYQMIYNDDGTVSFQDVTAYSQTGSVFGAKEVNEERAAINKINSDRIVTLDEVNLVTESGFFVDALAVKELIGKMDGAFLASDIASDVANGVRGGWKKIGNIVFVDMKFNLVASYKDAVVMTNLPSPKNDKSALAAANLSASRIGYGLIRQNGNLEWHDSQSPAKDNECSISGCYNCV